MSEPTKEDRLRALEARIAARKARDAPKPHQEEHYSQAQLAWRMVIELVSGLGIGFGIGYGLDALFGTQPFLMVLFIFFGLAAGVKTMLRTAQEAQARTEAQGRADEQAGSRGRSDDGTAARDADETETRRGAKEMTNGD